jgi:RNA polymerase sigma-70 factor (sigma-E family)
MSEQAVIALPRDRDTTVSMLFAHHHARLVGLARLLVDDLPTAEDVVQDAFASLYRRWPWLRDKDSAVAYLQTSVANGARSNLRRRRTARSRCPAASEVPSAETSVVADEERRRVLDALAQLPTRQRQVLVLRYYLDRSEAEIASALSISRGSVKQHASRGLLALAQQLEVAR